MEFNESLKRLLIEKNMKQADLCRLAHIQTSLMSEYINGKKSPTIGNAIQMADAPGYIPGHPGRQGGTRPLLRFCKQCLCIPAERMHGWII